MRELMRRYWMDAYKGAVFATAGILKATIPMRAAML